MPFPRILLKNANLVNEGKCLPSDVLIDGERISKIAASISAQNCTVIDLEGSYLIPGLIDDQVHFREPGLTHKGSIETESRAAVAGGITTFIEQPNTAPQTTTIEALEQKFELAKNKAFANYSFMLGGTNDNIEELKRLDPNACAGIKLFLGSSTGHMLVDDTQVLEAIFSNIDSVISVHCEDEREIRKNMAHYKSLYGDDIPMALHPIIRSEEACFLSSSMAVELAKRHRTRLHVFHVSTAKELELFRSTIPLEQKRITAEVCVHHLWFCEDDYSTKGTLIKWNPAIKKASDRQALQKGLLDNTIDVVATDHAPHTLEEKQQVYTKAPSGAPLVQHALLVLLELSKQGLLPIETLVEKMCHNPAVIFNIKDRGYVREGFFADLVAFDINKTTEVSRQNVLYKCGWSPLEGTRFSSQIRYTFVNGGIAYQNGLCSERRYAKRLTFNR